MYLVLVTFFIATVYSESFEKLEIQDPWEKYKEEHSLVFEITEESERRTVFEDNMKFIEEHNKKTSSFKLGQNKFTHMTHDEFVSRNKHIKTVVLNESKTYEDLTKGVWTSVDWRIYHVISPVVDQGACGSAYAHAAISTIETHHALRNNLGLEYLSAQEIVDCTRKHGNLGCYGGHVHNAYQYIIEHGISKAGHYLFTGNNKVCQVKSPEGKKRIRSFAQVIAGDDDDLIRAVSSFGAVTVSMDSKPREIQFYKSGIIDFEGCSQTELDHHATAVGYDLTGPVPFMILKNSWGQTWGEDGYFRVRLYKNMCGIASDASYPIV